MTKISSWNMTDDPAVDSDPPLTDEELDERDIALLDIDDQIRYAVFNGHYRIGEIVEVTVFDAEWTKEIVDDMVEEGNLVKGTDKSGPFYMLPPDERNDGLDPDERAEIHETARAEHEADSMLGDEKDVIMSMDTDSDEDDEPAETDAVPDVPEGAYADSAEAMSSDGSSGSSSPAHASDIVKDGHIPDDAAVPSWYEDLVEAAKAGELPHPLPRWEDITRAMRDHGGMLPVDRDYDWDEERLHSDNIPEFIQANGEYDDIADEIEMRREIDKHPHFCISGPTGCGKTLLSENIALDMGPGNQSAPVIEIHCHEGLRPSNLLGMPTYVGDETWWVDGPVPKALLASQEQPVVVILDEVNRTSSRTLGVLMSMLDHQCRVTLDARGGEQIEGDPMNLIVFSTMNEGEGYVVNSVDTAQKRRLGNKYYTDYIGMTDLSEEVDLITERTPVPEFAAREMVKCANAIRQKADGDSAVHMGVPTDAILDWAATAWVYKDGDAPKGPLVKAATRSVINKYYSGDPTEEDTVREIVHTHLEGMSLDEDDTDESEMGTVSDEVGDEDTIIEAADETYLMCESCGWYSLAEEASEDVMTAMSCPNCESPVIPKDSP